MSTLGQVRPEGYRKVWTQKAAFQEVRANGTGTTLPDVDDLTQTPASTTALRTLACDITPGGDNILIREDEWTSKRGPELSDAANYTWNFSVQCYMLVTGDNTSVATLTPDIDDLLELALDDKNGSDLSAIPSGGSPKLFDGTAMPAYYLGGNGDCPANGLQLMVQEEDKVAKAITNGVITDVSIEASNGEPATITFSGVGIGRWMGENFVNKASGTTHTLTNGLYTPNIIGWKECLVKFVGDDGTTDDNSDAGYKIKTVAVGGATEFTINSAIDLTTVFSGATNVWMEPLTPDDVTGAPTVADGKIAAGPHGTTIDGFDLPLQSASISLTNVSTPRAEDGFFGPSASSRGRCEVTGSFVFIWDGNSDRLFGRASFINLLSTFASGYAKIDIVNAQPIAGGSYLRMLIPSFATNGAPSVAVNEGRKEVTFNFKALARTDSDITVEDMFCLAYPNA